MMDDFEDRTVGHLRRERPAAPVVNAQARYRLLRVFAGLTTPSHHYCEDIAPLADRGNELGWAWIIVDTVNGEAVVKSDPPEAKPRLGEGRLPPGAFYRHERHPSAAGRRSRVQPRTVRGDGR